MARKHKAAVPVPFYVCHRPSFDEAMNDCDRPLFEWLGGVPEPARTPPMQRVHGEIFAATEAARDQAVESCESGRYAADSSAAEPGVRVSVVTALKGAGRRAASPPSPRRSARLELRFAPSTCPLVPFEVLHTASASAAIEYSGSSPDPERVVQVEWVGAPYVQPEADGPFAGMVVLDTGGGGMGGDGWSGNGWPGTLPTSARIYINKLIEFSVSPVPVDGIPAELLARAESFDAERVSIGDLRPDVSVPFGWRRRLEWLHEDSGDTAHSEYRWDSGMSPGTLPDRFPRTGRSVFGYDHTHYLPYVDGNVSASTPPVRAGWWRVRLSVDQFYLPPAAVDLDYAGQLWSPVTVSHTPMVGSPRVPFSADIAHAEMRLFVCAVGARQPFMRIESIGAVPGIGIRVAFRLMNSLPVSACVAVFFQALDAAFKFTEFIVGRTLSAQSESDILHLVLPTWPGETPEFRFGLKVIREARALQPGALDGDFSRLGENTAGIFPISGFIGPADLTYGAHYYSSPQRVRFGIVLAPQGEWFFSAHFDYIEGVDRPEWPLAPVSVPSAPALPSGVVLGNRAVLYAFLAVSYRIVYRSAGSNTSLLGFAHLTNADAAALYGRRLRVSDADLVDSPYGTVALAWSGGDAQSLAQHLIDTQVIGKVWPWQPDGSLPARIDWAVVTITGLPALLIIGVSDACFDDDDPPLYGGYAKLILHAYEGNSDSFEVLIT